jgi:hypothetical protein
MTINIHTPAGVFHVWSAIHGMRPVDIRATSLDAAVSAARSIMRDERRPFPATAMARIVEILG